MVLRVRSPLGQSVAVHHLLHYRDGWIQGFSFPPFLNSHPSRSWVGLKVLHHPCRAGIGFPQESRLLQTTLDDSLNFIIVNLLRAGESREGISINIGSSWLIMKVEVHWYYDTHPSLSTGVQLGSSQHIAEGVVVSVGFKGVPIQIFIELVCEGPLKG